MHEVQVDFSDLDLSFVAQYLSLPMTVLDVYWFSLHNKQNKDVVGRRYMHGICCNCLFVA